MHNILVIRNDKLGDFMLIWPALALLKKQYPECTITALVPFYTAPMAKLCPWIDKVIIDEKGKSFISGLSSLTREIRSNQFTGSISYFSTARTALALCLARVPYRYGPATKLAQLCLNRKLKQRRSSSLKPEYEYNTDLSKFYIESRGDTLCETPTPPYLTFPDRQTKALREYFTAEHDIPRTRSLIILHPGSGGSAINLSVEQFSELAQSIASTNDVFFIITAGPDEIATAQALEKLMTGLNFCVHHSQQGITEFSLFISICDLFISGSTGPLHIAGALDIATIAFYPSRKSATALRWQTLNNPGKRLAFTIQEQVSPNSQPYLDISACTKEITGLLEKKLVDSL